MRSQSVDTTKVLSFLSARVSLQWCRVWCTGCAGTLAQVLHAWPQELYMHGLGCAANMPGLSSPNLTCLDGILSWTSHFPRFIGLLAGPGHCQGPWQFDTSGAVFALLCDHTGVLLSSATPGKQLCQLLPDESLLSWPLKSETSSSSCWWDYNILSLVTTITPARYIPAVVWKQDSS